MVLGKRVRRRKQMRGDSGLNGSHFFPRDDQTSFHIKFSSAKRRFWRSMVHPRMRASDRTCRATRGLVSHLNFEHKKLQECTHVQYQQSIQ